jgi:mono/diheme cytochrome c family protein
MKNAVPVSKTKALKLIILLTGTLFLFSCDNKDNTDTGKSNEPQATVSTTSTENKVSTLSNEEQIQKGKSIYFSTCIACHNSNPEKDGSVGPAIKGSTLALLKERIHNSSYPPGYKPKRTTKLMPKLPLTDEQISYVEAFLK